MPPEIPSILGDHLDAESFEEEVARISKAHRDGAERIRRRYAEQEPPTRKWHIEGEFQGNPREW